MDIVSIVNAPATPKIKPDTADLSGSVLARAKPMRIGAFTVDAETSTIQWRGEPLRLSDDEHKTLRVLLQHAGQIVSCDRLASLLHVASNSVDARVRSLRVTLEASNVTWLPRRAEGCGYILWR